MLINKTSLIWKCPIRENKMSLPLFHLTLCYFLSLQLRFSYVETSDLNSHSGKPWESISLGLTLTMHSTVWFWKLALPNTKAQANGYDQRLSFCLKQFSHQKEVMKIWMTTILILPFKIIFFKIVTFAQVGRATFNIVGYGLFITNSWHTSIYSICYQAKCNFTHIHESINKN